MSELLWTRLGSSESSKICTSSVGSVIDDGSKTCSVNNSKNVNSSLVLVLSTTAFNSSFLLIINNININFLYYFVY